MAWIRVEALHGAAARSDERMTTASRYSAPLIFTPLNGSPVRPCYNQGGTVPDCRPKNRTECGSQRPRTERVRFLTAERANRSDCPLGTGRLPVPVDTLCEPRGLSRSIEFSDSVIALFLHNTPTLAKA